VDFEMPNEDDEIAIPFTKRNRDFGGAWGGAVISGPRENPDAVRARWATLIGPMRERLRVELARQP
jgi:hypothetical protein